MGRAGPLLESLLEENEQIRFIKDRDLAAKKPAVEMKNNLKFPPELAFLFSSFQATQFDEDNPTPSVKQPAQVTRITAMHMFEASPQSKCAVAYHLVQSSGRDCFPIVVFHVGVNQIMRICYSDVEITQMCTSGEDDVLICGTVLGSLMLYDLKDYSSISYIAQFLNWEALS